MEWTLSGLQLYNTWWRCLPPHCFEKLGQLFKANICNIIYIDLCCQPVGLVTLNGFYLTFSVYCTFVQ